MHLNGLISIVFTPSAPAKCAVLLLTVINRSIFFKDMEDMINMSHLNPSHNLKKFNSNSK